MTADTKLTLGCLIPISDSKLAELESVAKVYYWPDGKGVDRSKFPEIDVLFGIPDGVKDLSELPRLKHVQLCSSGSDGGQNWPPMAAVKAGERDVSLATASGAHALTIPNYVVAMVLNIYHQIPKQILNAKEKKTWTKDIDVYGRTYGIRQTRGRTAGLLGYGSLGRESARLLKALGFRIIAANTSGSARRQDGYIPPGGGDVDGKIPEKYYSTEDESQVKDFLSQCDVLVASLPNTAKTRGFLTKERFAMLPPQAVFISVGRGNVATSEDILTALDAKDGLFGAALDVTDPEPLPDNHPLWSHPKVVVTPHCSGDPEGEMDITADVLMVNLDRLGKGEPVINRVDFAKGY